MKKILFVANWKSLFWFVQRVRAQLARLSKNPDKFQSWLVRLALRETLDAMFASSNKLPDCRLDTDSHVPVRLQSLVLLHQSRCSEWTRDPSPGELQPNQSSAG